MSNGCPLCLSDRSQFFYQDKKREYWRCLKCRLVFVPEAFHLSPEDEKREYDQHQNSPNDQGYRTFLNRLVEPLFERLSASATGLDFGCGPGPTLSVMFAEQGVEVSDYDQFYAADTALLNQQYDFVSATEVVEHIRNPNDTFQVMWNCVKEGGYLGLMTKLVIDQQRFAQWHYKNDPTHIAFYSLDTFHYLADLWLAEFTQITADSFIFKKTLKP